MPKGPQGQKRPADFVGMSAKAQARRTENIDDFQRFCDRIAERALQRGLTEEKLLEILNPENGAGGA